MTTGIISPAVATVCVYAFIALFGAVVGSFLNVCIYRMPRGESVIRPRSRCPLCGAGLRPRELIPVVSYIWLGGRCARCRGRISPVYPLVEAASGALWAALFWRFGPTPDFPVYAALFSVLLAILCIDLRWLRIPNALVLCASLPAAAACARYLLQSPPERFAGPFNSLYWYEAPLGLIPCAFFIAVFAISAAVSGKSGIGMGDIKLLIPVGLSLGLWQAVFAAFVAVVLGGITGVALIAVGIKKMKDPIPFGPFIVVGALAAVFIPVAQFFL